MNLYTRTKGQRYIFNFDFVFRACDQVLFFSKDKSVNITDFKIKQKLFKIKANDDYIFSEILIYYLRFLKFLEIDK
jgi:hypothetical protein